ncbi:hypothetical protein PMIN05_011364 [Paraphaeosphaeria minitans]
MVDILASMKALSLFAACVLSTASYPAIPSDKSTPVQQRLAVKGSNGNSESTLSDAPKSDVLIAVSVGWNTYQKLAQPCVEYGTSTTSLTSKQCSISSVTYPTSRTYSNAVTLTGLTPATTYYYKIVSTNSSVEHFLSPRVPGDNTPFSINAIIDLGVYGADGFTIQGDQTKRDIIPTIDPSLNHTTIDRLARTVDDYEFIIHPGDLAYGEVVCMFKLAIHLTLYSRRLVREA